MLVNGTEPVSERLGFVVKGVEGGAPMTAEGAGSIGLTPKASFAALPRCKRSFFCADIYFNQLL